MLFNLIAILKIDVAILLFILFSPLILDPKYLIRNLPCVKFILTMYGPSRQAPSSNSETPEIPFNLGT